MTSVGPLAGFLDSLPFTPDRFQVEAIEHIAAGRSVVVSAPTGAGKTLIAEAAVELARRRGRRAFYTTPIKALSNQKFGDLRAIHGEEAVGLLTGDDVVNGDAGIVVMTTEVLRNMIYADSDALADLAVVVLDEVHYLQDRYRGSVWEEVIIHLERAVQLVNLSATVANAEEFTDWVRSRRGPTALVEETNRPVPLESMYMVEDRHREKRIEMLPLFDRRGRPNPTVMRLLAKGRGRRPRFAAPRRLEVTAELRREGLLPAIYFIFSRAGCDQAAAFVASARLGLTEPAERSEIRAVAEEMTGHLSATDLAVLGYGEWLAGLEAGVAAHHAGLVPAFKQTVERLFAAGLLRIVFATETLALGINMPARSVVLERLSKFNGESHELLQPGDYTQLTGRAGRRGIDTVGTAVVLHQRDLPFERVAAIAGRGAHPLVSSFAPSYNMAVNLVARYSRERAEELLRASFAQHRIVSRDEELAGRIAEWQADIAAFRAAAACDRGDIEAFVEEQGGDVRRRMRDFAQGVVAGQVLGMPGPDGATARWAVVARGYGSNPRLLLVGEAGEVRRQLAGDLPPATAIVATVSLPEPFRPRERSYQRAVAEALREAETEAPAPAGGGGNPVATCPQLPEHLSWLERARKAEREIARLQRRLSAGDGDDLVARFGALIGLLEDRGYLDGWGLTPRGERLRRLYNELDLLVVEAAEEGVLSGLRPEELAATLSAFVYEPRRSDTPGAIPTPAVGRAVDSIMVLSDEIAAAEDRRGITMMRPPDDGYVERIHGWASGATLEDLFDDEAAAGDFVRIARQTLDLLRQVRDAFAEVRGASAAAIDAIDRGVVAAGGQG